jgi:hypothetical protein
MFWQIPSPGMVFAWRFSGWDADAYGPIERVVFDIRDATEAEIRYFVMEKLEIRAGHQVGTASTDKEVGHLLTVDLSY